MRKTVISTLSTIIVLLGLIGCRSQQFDNPLDAQTVFPGTLNPQSFDSLIIYKEVSTHNGLLTMYEVENDDHDCVSVAFISENNGHWKAEASGSTCDIDRTKTHLDTFKGSLAAIYGFVPTQATYMQVVWNDGVTTQTDIGRDGVILFPRYDSSKSPESFVLYDASHSILERGVFSESRLEYRSP